MSSQDYSGLINKSRKLVPCQKNKVFLSTSYNPRLGQIPDTYITEVTNSSSATINRNQFRVDIVSDTDLILYEGTVFEFDGKYYYLGQTVELFEDDPVLNVIMESIEEDILQDGWRGELKTIIPYYSVNSVVETEENEVIENNVFSGGFGVEKALVGTNMGYELTGARVQNDLGYDILKHCKETGDLVNVQIVDSYLVGVTNFIAICISLDRVIERGDFFQIKCVLGKLI